MKRYGSRLCVVSTAAALSLGIQGASYLNDDASCGECHPSEYEKHSRSIHLQMIRPTTGANLQHVHGNLNAPNAPTPNDITHTIGGWYKEESYIKMEVVNGKTNYTVTKFEWNPIKGTYANDRALRDWLVKCAGCHTTGYDVNTRTFQDFNIHCEACHGPSASHVADPARVRPVIDRSSEGCGFCHIRAESAPTDVFPAKTFNFPIGYVLGDPSSLKFIPEPLTNLASFFPDGTANRHREQYLDTYYPGFRVTRHYAMGISCTKCHDPHSVGIVTVHAEAQPPGKSGVKIYNNVTGATNFVEWDGEGLLRPAGELCVTCHAAKRNEHIHSFTSVAQAAAQSGRVTCVDCHMPDLINIDPVTLRGALHTHTYHTLRPERSLWFGADSQPNSCTYRCHQDKGATKAERAQWAAAYTGVLLTPAYTSQGVRLQGKGLLNFEYRIEGSSDFTTWMPIATQKAVDGGFLITSPATERYQFYRAVELRQQP